MSLLYGRRARLVVGDVEVVTEGDQGLRMAFAVQRNTAASANTARVTVFNLGSDTRARLDGGDIGEERTYTTRAGDTLARVAKRNLPPGATSAQVQAEARSIASRNGISDPSRLEPGQVLILSPGTRRPSGEVRRLILEAGYRETSGLIFCGDKAWVSHQRQGTEWVTTIEAADGLGALNYQLSESFAEDTDLLTVARALLERVGIQAGQIARGSADPEIALALEAVTLPKGWAVSGRFREAMIEVARMAGLQFSIQDCEVRFSLPRKPETPEQGPFLSPQSGLIGSPQRVRDPKRPSALIVRGASLLMPTLVPGRRMRLQSDTASGVFKLAEVAHSGDTHGGSGAWATTWEAVAV